jgi:hypothetical protein
MLRARTSTAWLTQCLQIGIDPYALFLSLSPLVLASAFMIGSAAVRAQIAMTIDLVLVPQYSSLNLFLFLVENVRGMVVYSCSKAGKFLRRG